jgi:luciferase family oxidoreductase group 1
MTGAHALANSLDLAQLADRLGYHRYWVAEHHGTPALACAAPEALIGPIATLTRRMRVGSGGVMLPHYSPLKVAEVFSMFAGLFPDRIDLGLGRAPGTDQATSFALQRDRRQHSPDDFPQQLAELLGYLYDQIPASHPFARYSALPGRPGMPEPWMLGSSPQSGIWAAELGLPYMFADFINPTGAAIAERYLRDFTPSAELAQPRMAVAASAICAETDEEADRLAASGRMLLTLLRQGNLIPVPTIEKAQSFFTQQGLPPNGRIAARRTIIGAPATVRAGIEALAAEYGAEEVMVVTITHDHVARKRSYELIAEAFGLPRQDHDRP